MKKLILASAAAFALSACTITVTDGEDDNGVSNGSQSVRAPRGFYSVQKSYYEVDEASRVITVIEPVCEEDRGELVWDRRNGYKYDWKYNVGSNGTVTIIDDEGERQSYDYDGRAFPVGVWSGVENEAMRTTVVADDGLMDLGFTYDGECFLRDVFMKEMGGDFGDLAGDEDSEEIMELLKLDVGCTRISMFDGDIMIEMNSWKNGTMSGHFTYGSNSCDNTITQRYAFNESDCRAAYDDFMDEGKSDEFYFDEYAEEKSNPKCQEDMMTYLMVKMLPLLLGGGDGDFDFMMKKADDPKVKAAKKFARKLSTLSLKK